MADDCEQHRGTEAETSPHLDQILEELPENQSGAGRHKCAYCAYEAGILAGLEQERRRIARWFGVDPSELDPSASNAKS